MLLGCRCGGEGREMGVAMCEREGDGCGHVWEGDGGGHMWREGEGERWGWPYVGGRGWVWPYVGGREMGVATCDQKEEICTCIRKAEERLVWMSKGGRI